MHVFYSQSIIRIPNELHLHLCSNNFLAGFLFMDKLYLYAFWNLIVLKQKIFLKYYTIFLWNT